MTVEGFNRTARRSLRAFLLGAVCFTVLPGPAAADTPRAGALYQDGQSGRYLLGGSWFKRADPGDRGRKLGWELKPSLAGWQETTVPNAANAEDLLTDPASKQLLRAATAPTAMSKPLAAPPGLPADRLQALRDAYTATLNDPAFQADATQARLTIVPHSGQQVEQVVNDVLNLDPALGKRLADIRS